MYAELSDFFYVWLKRSVGHLFPEFFSDELTNKDDEAVANPARFASTGKKKKALSEQDYERKMAAAFREMHRVLTSDGSLTVMFTHKKVEAWDTLGSALISAGFVIKASWPVHTESEHSLHQAKKNAAASTILLVCRKRAATLSGSEPVWWEDIKGTVRQVARESAERFNAAGIRGVDLYISTFGPALSVISEHWPVLTAEVDEKTGQPRALRPETALDLAREEVITLRKRGLLQGREARFDAVTDWYLMAWDAFKAAEFPADEARKLALALGVDLEATLVREKHLIAKKASTVILQEPLARRKKGMVDPDLTEFPSSLDALHTALLVLDEDGDKACERFLTKARLLTDSTFRACLQAAINAIPLARPESVALERLRTLFFDDLPAAPREPEPELKEVQIEMFEAEAEEEGEGEEEE
jgi:adenine-specific DNA methylase